ncbi:hypothetical protein [Collimonas sp. PA-H2]|uniref:hypothetical protein n=1 Tax=Collimonas sp. PA-H2 TaxID=1881062 RepID=UPI00117D238B|nr:hypothetical protein [Collimonas sp. PA-H2]
MPSPLSTKNRKLLDYTFLAFLILILGAVAGAFIGPPSITKSCLGVFSAGTGLLILAGCIRAIFTGEYKYGQPGLWKNIEKKEDRPFGFWVSVIPVPSGQGMLS